MNFSPEYREEAVKCVIETSRPIAQVAKVCVAGEVLSMRRRLHEAVEQGSGQALDLRCLGTVDELAAEIERRKATARSPLDYIALQYQWTMVSGEGQMHQLDNHRYPSIQPTSVADTVRAILSA